MTREEKAHSLGQMCFPDDQNIWARPNYEAKFVSDACLQMAEWERERLVEKACEWLISSFDKLRNEYGRKLVFGNQDVFIEAFKKEMEK
jgi:hypothetical protein